MCFLFYQLTKLKISYFLKTWFFYNLSNFEICLYLQIRNSPSQNFDSKMVNLLRWLLEFYINCLDILLIILIYFMKKFYSLIQKLKDVLYSHQKQYLSSWLLNFHCKSFPYISFSHLPEMGVSNRPFRKAQFPEPTCHRQRDQCMFNLLLFSSSVRETSIWKFLWLRSSFCQIQQFWGLLKFQNQLTGSHNRCRELHFEA